MRITHTYVYLLPNSLGVFSVVGPMCLKFYNLLLYWARYHGLLVSKYRSAHWLVTRVLHGAPHLSTLGVCSFYHRAVRPMFIPRMLLWCFCEMGSLRENRMELNVLKTKLKCRCGTGPCLLFLIEVKFTQHKLTHFKEHKSLAFSTCAVVCSHYRFPMENVWHPKEDPGPCISDPPPSFPSPPFSRVLQSWNHSV